MLVLQSSLGSVHATAYIDPMMIFLSIVAYKITVQHPGFRKAPVLTFRNNKESLPGDAPLPPALMNIYSEKNGGKKSGKAGLNIAAQDCILNTLIKLSPTLQW